MSVEKYPTINVFNFRKSIENSVNGGRGLIIIPKGQKYIPKRFGYEELKLMPYLQELLETNETITVRRLKDILDEENENTLTNESFETPYYYRILNKLITHDIIWHKKEKGPENSIHLDDLITKGLNYDKAKVVSMIPYSNL
ncbi:MAG: hypothetical protein ACLFPQ_02265 [Candidatus Woesearchaeota archaeon]